MDEPGTEQPDTAEAGQTSYLRLPWPQVALGLVGIVVVALAIGLFANRYLRLQVGLVSTPVAALTPVPPATPAPPPATSPPVGAAPTPAPTQLAQTLPSATATPHRETPTPTEALPAVTPSARPTLDPVQVAEVSAAYDRYWQVRSEALLDLDKTRLPEVMGGDHLNSIAQLVDQLQGENRAIKTDVDHDSHVVGVKGDAAEVADDYISNSFYVDPVTKHPLSEPGSDELRVLYRMAKFNGTWRVVDSVRAD